MGEGGIDKIRFILPLLTPLFPDKYKYPIGPGEEFKTNIKTPAEL